MPYTNRLFSYDDLEVLWGLYSDDTLGNQVKVAIVATGFDDNLEVDVPPVSEDETRKQKLAALKQIYYGTPSPQPTEAVSAVQEKEPTPETVPADSAEEDEASFAAKGMSGFKKFMRQLERILGEED